ncbi:MAG: hypothetical protein LBE59_09645 [Nevskiaceae bacterium]|jgi:hypothetical protein|nr:hypothetical protein [Nevskiaceae bacterium]
MKPKHVLLAVAAAVALVTGSVSVLAAQARGQQNQTRTPAPRLPDGKIDFGGNGVWNLPYVTNMAARMVGYKEGDLPPMLPWARAMYQYNRANDVKYDPEGFCLPPGGPRSMGTPYPMEIIQNRDRIIMIFEGGGHVWREIHMDGREHPKQLNPTYFGHSVGHWEGDTLVVDTVGYNEKTWVDFSGLMHTEQLHTVERISRPFKEVLRYEATYDDPGAYTAPWNVTWDIPWSEGQELADYICQENNQYLLDMHDDLGQPFFQKSEGL